MPFEDLIDFYAARFGIPRDMAQSQMMKESSGRPLARSKAGALGLMQLLPTTAAWVEQFPEPAIMTGLWLLRRLYDQVENAATDADRWRFALAGYNAGPSAVQRMRAQAAAAGKDPNQWAEVSAFAPEETRKYVASISGPFPTST
jgi:soluble lytic murein transglycosylase-like protein